MLHARPDYDRIQDPAGLIPDEEPVFLLRGQDEFAARLVYEWACMALAKGIDPAMCDLAFEQAERMRTWQPHKRPDLPK
jgi:hypothetical protein